MRLQLREREARQRDLRPEAHLLGHPAGLACVGDRQQAIAQHRHGRTEVSRDHRHRGINHPFEQAAVLLPLVLIDASPRRSAAVALLLSACRSRRRDSAELLQEPELVERDPVLGDLAVGDAVDLDG
jgi:hypothetical protein